MNKPAKVILDFEKANNSFWWAMVEHADNSSFREFGNRVVAFLAVKSYSMDDHQFIQIKIEVNKGTEVQVWIPRDIVKGIVEGKTDLSAAFSFAGSKIK